MARIISHLLAGATVGLAVARAQTSTTTSTTSTAEFASVTDCHLHETDIYCMAGASEYRVIDSRVTATQDLPAQYTGCHSHDGATYVSVSDETHGAALTTSLCVDASGEDVEVVASGEDVEVVASDASAEHEPAEPETAEHDMAESETSGQTCHFHAGVEHCVDADGESASATTCERVDRDYNISLRIGMVFVMLATSLVGVLFPVAVQSLLPNRMSLLLSTLKQFGTGVIISTALVHLYTHAYLLFSNECIGELSYESTTSAVFMAGIFVSFLVELAGQRYLDWRRARTLTSASDEQAGIVPSTSQELLKIYVMEAGILFHSLLIGITLVVTGDSYFLTFLVVIIFHQFFEAIALGSRIAALGTGAAVSGLAVLGHYHGPVEPAKTDAIAVPVSLLKKTVLAVSFAVSTPIGMAIGIGALQQFNGNDKVTVIAIATLDAFSGGILIWVGVVEMLAADWMHHGDMARAGPLKTLLGLAALVTGLVLMSFLGKWA